MGAAVLLAPPEHRRLAFASEAQQQGFEHGPTPLLLSGGWGSGKTWTGCVKGLYLSSRYRKNRGAVIRHHANDLRETTRATWFKWCPPIAYAPQYGGRRNDQNGYLRLAGNLSEVLFLHMDDPETAGIIRGLEINWFLWDQAEENPEHGEELFDMLLGRLGRWDVAEVSVDEIAAYEREHGRPWPYVHPESGKPVPPVYPMLTCNPDVETHWLYRRFHPESEDHQRLYKPLGYTFIDMPSEANRFLGEQNKQFLLAHDEAFIRRNVKGLWGQPEGAIHAIPKEALVKGSPDVIAWIARSCAFFRTLDHGDSAPTCCLWWGVDHEGNCFVWQEYYQGNKPISFHRANIAGMSPHGQHYDQDLADPSIFHKFPIAKGGRTCVADEYAEVIGEPRATAIFWTPADNNEMGTRNRINEYLRVDPERIHPITRERGAPRLFFILRTDAWPTGVAHALRETRNQRRVKIGTELGKPIFSDERDDTITDHAYDPVRYGIASRPAAPSLPLPPTHGTFSGVLKMAKQFRRQGAVR